VERPAKKEGDARTFSYEIRGLYEEEDDGSVRVTELPIKFAQFSLSLFPTLALCRLCVCRLCVCARRVVCVCVCVCVCVRDCQCVSRLSVCLSLCVMSLSMCVCLCARVVRVVVVCVCVRGVFGRGGRGCVGGARVSVYVCVCCLGDLFRMWTQPFKEHLESLVAGTEKSPAVLKVHSVPPLIYMCF